MMTPTPSENGNAALPGYVTDTDVSLRVLLELYRNSADEWTSTQLRAFLAMPAHQQRELLFLIGMYQFRILRSLHEKLAHYGDVIEFHGDTQG